MIYEATKIQIKANTIKRFFQQRTGNPQLATKDALCKFLGYYSYTDFVLRITESSKEEMSDLQNVDEKDAINKIEKEYSIPAEKDEKSKASLKKKLLHSSRGMQKLIYLLFAFIAIIICYLFYSFILKDWYIQYKISKIEFFASEVKGVAPLTITFFSDIPSILFNDISMAFEEANGDVTERKPKKDIHLFYASYIYEGEAFCYLKYKGTVIRTIPIIVVKPDWSVYAREERKKIFQVLPVSEAYNLEKYLSLPLDKISEEARTNHLFVSYVFFFSKLVSYLMVQQERKSTVRL